MLIIEPSSGKPQLRRVEVAAIGRAIAEQYSRYNAFLNVPYDELFEPLFLAFVAGLCGFGLRPRAVLELPGPERRLDRIRDLISACRYSFHDLSRIQLSAGTPRFNMPFELGIAVEIAQRGRPRHQWFVFEARRYRLQRSLSDLNGTDPHIHEQRPRRVLIELSNAFVRARRQPRLNDLERTYRFVSAGADTIKRAYGTLFGARPFKDLVLFATDYVDRTIA